MPIFSMNEYGCIIGKQPYIGTFHTVFATSFMSILNSNGPKTESRGTPYTIPLDDEETLLH